MQPARAFSALPKGLRDPLLAEYESIIQNFVEGRWSPAELSGGRFSEIVYTILDGHAKGGYSAKPVKPANFVAASRGLEQNVHEPRSFQILIPRALSALYEIRNNRGVGHVGGDVDPNHMDATAVVAISSWIMAELVRVLHDLTTNEARELVDQFAERRTPLVWHGSNVKRVLDSSLALKDQILVLLAHSAIGVLVTDLQRWTGYSNKTYFLRLLRAIHRGRLVELSADEACVQLLPPGQQYVEKLIARRTALQVAARPERRKRAGRK